MAADPTHIAYELILKCAPEQSHELQTFWNTYDVRFEIGPDRTGILMNANKTRVQYAHKDLQIIWLMSFSIWKSIEAFAPAVTIPSLTGVSTASILKFDKSLDEIERNYAERIKAVECIMAMSTLDFAFWPPDIPKAVENRDVLESIEEKAVFDLAAMAIGIVFLHELRHVKFHRDHCKGSPRPVDLAEEELLCDVWARDWFMSKLAHYASTHGHDYGQVCSKRAMALLIVCEFLRLADTHAGGFGSSDYPPLVDRIAALSAAMPLGEEDNFWIVSACVLLAELRRQGQKSVEIPQVSPKLVTEFLIKTLSP